MGGQPWWYFIDYEPDVNAGLQALREREFKAGRYNPVIPFLEFPIDPNCPSPGAQHFSIEEAMEASDADGTRSILDVYAGLSDTPDYGCVAPLSTEKLILYFGTDKPTHEMIDSSHDFFDDIERGQGIYVIVCKEGNPSEIFFAGYSYD